jgi:hypothetical protein
MCEDPHESKFIEIAYDRGPGHIWLHTTLEGPWLHYMILELCWDSLQTLSFGVSQSHGPGSWVVREVALSSSYKDGQLNILFDPVSKEGFGHNWSQS